MSPVVAQSGRPAVTDECPLLRGQRTHSLASCDLLTQGAIGHATADQLMTKGHLAMTRWPNGRERERKLSRISKVRALHPLSLLRGLGISYPVSKYFVAATVTHVRIARID
jgi:hypothetical protein